MCLLEIKIPAEKMAVSFVTDWVAFQQVEYPIICSAGDVLHNLSANVCASMT